MGPPTFEGTDHTDGLQVNMQHQVHHDIACIDIHVGIDIYGAAGTENHRIFTIGDLMPDTENTVDNQSKLSSSLPVFRGCNQDITMHILRQKSKYNPGFRRIIWYWQTLHFLLQ